MPNKKNYDNLITDIRTILDEMTSSSTKDFIDIIADYIKTNFRSETRYGVLLKKPTGYDLLVYTRAQRTDRKPKTEWIEVTVPRNFPMFSSSTSLEGLVLIKAVDGKEIELFNFYKSIILKKVIPALSPTHPCNSENFIYLNFLNTINSPVSYRENIKKVKQQFHQTLPSFYHFHLQDQKNYLIDLRKEINNQLSIRQWIGSTTIILDSHCGSGSSYLTGEIQTPQGLKSLTWTIEQLTNIFKEFHFPHSASLIFDLYMCFAGKSSALSASFASQWNDILIKEGYQNFSIKASLQAVALCSDEPWILCQSPRLTTQHGFLTLPLTSFASLQNTETYITIFGLLDYSHITSKSFYQQAVCALQASASTIVKESKITVEYEDAHEKLKEMLTQFENFNKFLQQNYEKFTQKIYDPFYAIFMKILNPFEKKLAEIYAKNILKDPANFTLALEDMKEHYRPIQQKLNSVIELKNLKKQLLRQDFFNRQQNQPLLKLINHAEKGILSPEKSLEKIAQYKNQSKTNSSSPPNNHLKQLKC